MDKKKIALIVPCYNEHETIDSFVKACDQFLAPLKEKYDFITILINDGSKDDTLNIIRSWAEKRDDIKYVSFSRNFGKEKGLDAGFKAALILGADACIPMDVDLQDPPSMIADFIKYWEEGYQYVYAHMRDRKGQSFLKKIFSISFYKVFSLLSGDKLIASGDRDYALCDKAVIKAFCSLRERERFNRGVADYVGFKRKRIDYDFTPRTEGKTKFNMKRMFRYAIDAIKEFGHPYKIIPNSLLILSLIGTIIFAILTGLHIAGWCYLGIICSVMLFFLAIVSKVVVNMLYDIQEEARKRPLFFVGETNISGYKAE